MDVTVWPDWRKAIAWEDLDAVVAWRQLNDVNTSGGLSAAEIHDLVLAATRSKGQAEAAAKVRADTRMLRNLDP